MKINWPKGITTEIFLHDYWQQKPLLIRNALPDFENPLDPDELAGLACEEDASARFMERQGNGEWRMCHGPFDDDFFGNLSAECWSLLVCDVEKLLPDFHTWLAPFRFIPDWRIDDLMISYAPVGGSVGAHIDQYDVFLLQADGKREWQIESMPRSLNADSSQSDISLLSDFAADQSWLLSSTDMLYLPPAFAHHGIADTEPCMTWSIGFRAPSVADLLPSLLAQICQQPAANLRFGDAGRAITDSAGQLALHDREKLRRQIQRVLTPDNATLDHWIATALSDDDTLDTPSDESASNASNQNTMHQAFTTHSYKRYLYWPTTGDQAMLFAGGKAFQCSNLLAQSIADQHSLAAGFYATADQSDQKVIDELLRAQLLIESELPLQ